MYQVYIMSGGENKAEYESFSPYILNVLNTIKPQGRCDKANLSEDPIR